MVQELAELPAAVAAEAPADHLAGGHVDGCEQRGSAAALAIMGAPFGLAAAQR